MRRQADPITADGDLEDPILSAALDIFQESGLGSVTFRSVAQAAGVPTATIQRKFGSKEYFTYSVLSAFVGREFNVMETLLRETAGARVPRDNLPALLAAHIATPHLRKHRTALVEFLLAAVRNPKFRDIVTRWYAMKIASWGAIVGDDIAHAAPSVFILELEVALILETIGLDDGVSVELANAEIAAHALVGNPRMSLLWFGILLRKAIAEEESAVAEELSEELRDFLDAGASIVIRQGSDAIRFRAVAEKAQRTFAAASSVFRKKDVLVSQICRHMVDTAMRLVPPPLSAPRDLNRVANISCDVLMSGNELRGEYYLLGHIETRLLAARNGQFASHARRMRMMSGHYLLRGDDPSFDPLGLDAFAAYARAIWGRGVGLIHVAMWSDDVLRSRLLERLLAGVAHFERR